MHSLNIAHRDLKLENILLSEDFKIKLCDFGLSTVYIKDKHIDGPVGSAIYKSPENTAFKQYDAEKKRRVCFRSNFIFPSSGQCTCLFQSPR